MTRGNGVSHPAQQTIGALVSLERRRPTAAGLADGLATGLRRREADLVDIRVRAQKVCCAGGPRPCLHDVVEPAAQTNNGLQDGADFGDEQLVSRHSVSSRGPHVAGDPYTAPQAAEHLQCSHRWVKRLAETGRFPGAVKVGRSWAIPADAVERGLPTTGTSTPAVAGMCDITTAAERLGLSVRYVQRLAAGGQFAGASKKQGFWYIPTWAIEARLARQPRH